jgi:pyrroline-5-carboxylate reductase
MTGQTIGIIGGAGWLGRSIAAALVGSGFVQPQSMILSSRSGKLREPVDGLGDVRMTDHNRFLVAHSDVVILSVRPEDLASVHVNVQDKLLISLVAGVPLADIQLLTGGTRVVRAMPNAALEIGKSYTPWLANEHVDAVSRSYVQQLFATCGSADEVADEAQLDYLTALSGTGPAYPALLAQALYHDALAHGVPEHIARRAVNGVVVHASQLINQGRSFEELLETLKNYRGVSAAGIEGMLADGFERSVSGGVNRAFGVAQSKLFDVHKPRQG